MTLSQSAFLPCRSWALGMWPACALSETSAFLRPSVRARRNVACLLSTAEMQRSERVSFLRIEHAGRGTLPTNGPWKILSAVEPVFVTTSFPQAIAVEAVLV